MVRVFKIKSLSQPVPTFSIQIDKIYKIWIYRSWRDRLIIFKRTFIPGKNYLVIHLFTRFKGPAFNGLQHFLTKFDEIRK